MVPCVVGYPSAPVVLVVPCLVDYPSCRPPPPFAKARGLACGGGGGVAGLNRVYLEAGSGVLIWKTEPNPAQTPAPAPSPALNCHPAHPEPCQPDPASLTDPAPPAWSPSPIGDTLIFASSRTLCFDGQV